MRGALRERLGLSPASVSRVNSWNFTEALNRPNGSAVVNVSSGSRCEATDMDTEEALRFLETHGIVLASAKGPVPRMAEVIAGEPIRGSWWGHPKGDEIYRILGFLQESPDVLVCRVINGKITLVHRRLWPALIRVAGRFPRERLSKVEQVHTESGRHVNVETGFPEWADPDSLTAADSLTESQALEALGKWAG
jgi:hypothetical protein